ncbi:MAG: hypothetical protein ACRD1W_12270 [Vicinamibacterales bacterium]
MLYSAFGLSLAANWPIPGLIAEAIPSRPDIRIWRGENRRPSDFDAGDEERYYVSDDAEAGIPALQVWKAVDGAYFRLRYADATEFMVASTGCEVRAIAPDASTLEDTATYLLGPIIGFAMRLRGVTCLHASVVAIGDHAIALAGPAGAGKSTAAACFSAMGHAVLSDDIAALAEHGGMPHVQPAYPQIRLWPDSVTMLYGAPDALPRLTPTWDKRALALTQPGAFQRQSLPLRAVYLLGEECDRAEPAIEDVGGAQRLLVLLANTYVGYLLDRAMRHQEFESLARLASSVHVRRVIRPGASTPVRAICARILEDCERLGCTASTAMEQ